MKTIRLFDTRRPQNAPRQLTMDDAVASALVRSGVAAAADPAEQGALAAGGPLSSDGPVEIVLQVGALPRLVRVRVPRAAADIAVGVGLAAVVGEAAAGTPTPTPSPSPFFGSSTSTWGSSAPVFGVAA